MPGGLVRTGAAADATGYFHEMALYASDDELLEIVVPFLRDGIEAGEPTLITFAPYNAALVESVFGNDNGLVVLPGAHHHERPAVAIRSYRAKLASLANDGAHQIRLVGDIPHTGTGARWDEWVRYEAAINDAFAALPVWGLCPYDTRTAPEDVLADVLATHPHVATATSHAHNPHFGNPREVVASRRPVAVERRAADEILVNPTTAEARVAAAAVGALAGLNALASQDLAIVVSELTANARLHGIAPVAVELWAEPAGIDLAVSDCGKGPDDPLVGLIGPEDGPSGRGLWIAHQLCHYIWLDRHDHGFTVRATIRNTP